MVRSVASTNIPVDQVLALAVYVMLQTPHDLDLRKASGSLTPWRATHATLNL